MLCVKAVAGAGHVASTPFRKLNRRDLDEQADHRDRRRDVRGRERLRLRRVARRRAERRQDGQDGEEVGQEVGQEKGREESLQEEDGRQEVTRFPSCEKRPASPAFSFLGAALAKPPTSGVRYAA